MAKQSGNNRRTEANWISRLFFWWALSIIQLSNKKELELSDFDSILQDEKCDFLKSRLRANWIKELNLAKPSLVRAFFRTFCKEFVSIFFILGVSLVLFRLGTASFLGYIIRSLDEDTTQLHKYFLAGGYFLFIFGDTVLTHPITNYCQSCGVKARVAFTGLLYEKSLRLRQGSLSKTSNGQLTNLVSNDLNRFNVATEFIFYSLVAPIQAAVAMYTLWQYVGESVVAPFVLTVSLILLLIMIYGNVSLKLRTETAKQTDKRIRKLSEVISRLFLVKVLLLEAEYAEAIHNTRKAETDIMLKNAKLKAVVNGVFAVATRLNVLLTFLVFILLGHSATTDAVFVVLAVFNIVGNNVSNHLPFGMSILAEVLVSIRRVQEFLLLEEMLPLESHINPVCQSKDPSVKQQFRIEVRDMSIRWNPLSPLVFSDLSFTVQSGELVGVVGPVGSGKTTLLLAILSETPYETGQVSVVGSIAYTSQDAWLLPDTIQNNILFGLDYEPKWYQTVIEACALQYDFKNLEFGDKTIVGEKGANLSGGQKARISLARASYSKSEIYLLDDPISALDANVGHHIMEECIHGILKDKCVILVTHHVHFLKKANKIIRLGNRTIDHSESVLPKEFTIDELFDMEKTTEKTLGQIQKKVCENYGTFQPSVEEIRSVGKIRPAVIIEYLLAGSAWYGLVCSILLFITCQVFLTGSDVWLKTWTDMEITANVNMSNTSGNPLNIATKFYHLQYVGVYGLLILFAGILSVSVALKVLTDCVHSSINLHSKMTTSILRVPMRFVEINTCGQILNRFALDMGIMDEVLPVKIYLLISALFQVVASTIIGCSASIIMIIPTVIVYFVNFTIIKTYLRSAATIKRLEAIGRSPVLTQISSTMCGLPTIRAYQAQSFSTEKFNSVQDVHTSAFLSYLYTDRWFLMSIEIMWDIWNLVIISTLILTSTGPSTFGLVATSLLNVLSSNFFLSTKFSELSAQMTAAERVIEFTNVESEAPLRIPNHTPSQSWPNFGNIYIENLCVRYAKGPLVLRNININVKPREKIGIIGRTGAGKSTLISALLRIVEKSSGYIHIDGVNISEIGLHDLRGKISVIPQNPFLFSGTVRKAIDPFGRHDDAQIWEVLTMVQMQERVSDITGGLDSRIEDGGSNFSHGERQLLGFARTLLQQNKILALDEATSSIDPQTDSILQEIIRKRYKDCTVLTVAHRLNTVIDSDRILVLDSGNVVEFDDPISLLENPETYFHRLVKRTGPVYAQKLYNQAKDRLL